MNFPSQLLDAFWHTTSVSNYQAIIDSGFIHPEPSGVELRWGTGQGPEYYPFVRTLGGVSIFDFYGFNPDQYSDKFPMSSWYSFVPLQREWKNAIWIQLSPERMLGKFLKGLELKKLQEEQSAYKNKLMPRIECAHIGSIPVETFVSVLLYEEEQGFACYEH